MVGAILTTLGPAVVQAATVHSDAALPPDLPWQVSPPEPQAQAPPELLQEEEGPDTVDLSGATLTLKDLPAGFRVLSADELARFGISESSFAGAFRGFSRAGPLNLAGFQNADLQDQQAFELVVSLLLHPLTASEQASLDRELDNPDAAMEQLASALVGAQYTDAHLLAGTDRLGDKSLGFAVVVASADVSVQFDIVVARRGEVLELVYVFYYAGQQPRIGVATLAQILDQRVAAALGAAAPAFRPTGPLVPELTTFIPTPVDISTDPAVLGANLLFAAVAMILFAAASELLNRILAENEAALQRALRPARWIGRASQRLAAGLGTRLGRPKLLDAAKLVGIVLFYGLVFSFLERGWNPLSLTGLWLFLSMAIAFGLAGIADDIAQWRAARRWGLPADLTLRPANLLLAVLSTASSRLFALVPGIMFGTPESFEVDRATLGNRRERRLSLVSASTLLVLGFGAWLLTALTALLQRSVLPEWLAIGLGGIESLLLLVFAVTVQNIFVQMLALPESFGRALLRWNRWLWFGGLLVTTFVFYHTLLNPKGDLVKALGSANVRFFFITVVAFTLLTLAVWLYFRWRQGRERRLAEKPSRAEPAALTPTPVPTEAHTERPEGLAPGALPAGELGTPSAAMAPATGLEMPTPGEMPAEQIEVPATAMLPERPVPLGTAAEETTTTGEALEGAQAPVEKPVEQVEMPDAVGAAAVIPTPTATERQPSAPEAALTEPPPARETKRCPVCTQELAVEAVRCHTCGAEFAVLVKGYCMACHQTVEANTEGRCLRCGSAIIDRSVTSTLLREPLPSPPHPPPMPARELNVWPRQGEGVSVRLSAWFVDLIVIALISAIPVSLLVLLFHERGEAGQDALLTMVIAGLAVVLIVWFLYFTILEGAFGATLGKAIGVWPAATLRVVRTDGSRCGFGRAALRALLGPFETNLLGAIVIWVTGQKQRIGDLLAGTLVVAREKVHRITFLAQSAVVEFVDGRCVEIDRIIRADVQKWLHLTRMRIHGVTSTGRPVRLRLSFPHAQVRQRVRSELERFFQRPIPERLQWWRLVAMLVTPLLFALCAGAALLFPPVMEFTAGIPWLPFLPYREATFETIEQCPRGQRVIIEGYLDLPAHVDCNDACGVDLVDPSDPTRTILTFISVPPPGDTPTPNQMDRLPDTCTPSDLRVRADDGSYVSVGDRVRVSGIRWRTAQGKPCISWVRRIETLAEATPTPRLAPTARPEDTQPVPIGAPATAAPTPAPTESTCLPGARFVQDVSIPDGMNLNPGESFTKIWRIRSSGCAAWEADTRWVFVSGDRMGAPDGVDVPETALGQTADLSVPMQAPDQPGTYKGYWQMEGPDGRRFGDRVYVTIIVPGEVPTAPTAPPTPPPAGGSGTVQGRILWNDQPLAGVTVKLCADWSMFSGCQTPEYTGVTDAEGRYTIADVPAGAYEFITKIPGQSSETRWLGLSVQVAAGQTSTVRDVHAVKYDLRLLSPPDGATVDSPTPILSWEPYPGAAYYKVYLSGGPANQTVVDFEQTTAAQFGVATPLEPGKYYWRIYAYSGAEREIAQSERAATFTVAGP